MRWKRSGYKDSAIIYELQRDDAGHTSRMGEVDLDKVFIKERFEYGSELWKVFYTDLYRSIGKKRNNLR